MSCEGLGEFKFGLPRTTSNAIWTQQTEIVRDGDRVGPGSAIWLSCVPKAYAWPHLSAHLDLAIFHADLAVGGLGDFMAVGHDHER